jgi:phenylalanyl-tRNA synthetase beta chain
VNISHRWLQDLIPGLALSPQEVADRLAMLGAPVDEVSSVGDPLRDVVIARVVETQQHPNADRLSLCRVDAGAGELLQVVCGAPNVTAGAFYPFAPVGASLPGGITLRKAKIRGMESQGMLCSARELNLGRDHEGILELHGEFDVGRSFIESVGLAGDARLALDVTPNRPDLLSHVGVAREIAAAESLEWRLHELPGAGALPELVAVTDEHSAAVRGVTVTIEDTDLCPHYLGLIIRGVRVGPSPEWLASRLRALGLRPISNVVDATNWALHELGQPLHAFDLARLGDAVVVRPARAGERITTLDGVERKLDSGMLVIADAERPVAIAGVMGGADTEVQDDTRDLLLECALFAPASVRSTRRALNLSTDASYRFERGVDPDTMLTALRRAAGLIVAAAGGSVEVNVASAGPGLDPVPAIRLRRKRVEQILGIALTANQVRQCLAPLGFATEDIDADGMTVHVPGHRRYDVVREEDVIEEIARRHGYDAFPDDLRAFRPSAVPSHPLFALEDRLRALLAGRGFMEARTAAFAPEDAGTVSLLLPLAATESRLRARLLTGLLRRIEYNWSRGARSIRVFEIGTVFSARGSAELPAESTRLSIVCTGYRRPPHWSEPAPPFDVWDLRALAESVAELLDLRLEERAADELLDDGLSFTLVTGDNQNVGSAGRVRPERLDAPAWSGDVWALEVELPASGVAQKAVRYVELPQQPAIERDVALLVSDAQPVAGVLQVIRTGAGRLLEDSRPFDVYSGKGVPEGMRSVAYRLTFRAPDRTLTDEEVDDAMRRVLARLDSELGVTQRA